MSVEGLLPRVRSFSHTCQSERALWAGPGDTAADEAVADAAPGAFVQHRDCSKGMDGVVVELDAIRIDTEEVKGSLGLGRVMRGKNQGVVNGAVRAKPNGWCGRGGWSRQVRALSVVRSSHWSGSGDGKEGVPQAA